MEFKGTRGKWEYIYDGNDYCYDIVSDYGLICSTMSAGIKDRYNALLISKAPEMLELLQSLVSSENTPFTLVEKENKVLITIGNQICDANVFENKTEAKKYINKNLGC